MWLLRHGGTSEQNDNAITVADVARVKAMVDVDYWWHVGRYPSMPGRSHLAMGRGDRLKEGKRRKFGMQLQLEFFC